MFNNFTTMLNSLDNIAQENLEEPKISATSLRQQKREAAEGSQSNLSSLDSAPPSITSALNSTVPFDVGSNHNSETSFVVVDENDNQSDITISPKSNLSTTSSTEYVAAHVHLTSTDKQQHPAQHLDPPQATSTIPSSTSHIDKDTRQLIISKNKEIEKLNRECLELETQNEGLKQEVREAWAAYKTAQEKAALREADYQEDMSQLERAKSSDREGMASHVQTMEQELQARRNEVTSIRAEHERVVHVLHTLQEEAKHWKANKENLEKDLEIAQANNNQSLQGLREEIRLKDVYIETLQSEHSNVMRNAHQRHDALEQANSDLTSSLMTKERELTRLTSQQRHAQGARDDTSEAEVSKIRLKLEQMNSALQEEQEQHQSCLKRLRACDQEAEINRTAWDEEKQMLLSRISEMSSEQHVVVDMSSESPEGSNSQKHGLQEEEISRLEEQLRTLGQQLLRKQETLEEYLSERAALKVRLQDAQRRCQKFEEQVACLLESQDPYDYEASLGDSGAGGVRRSDSGHFNLRNRGAGSGSNMTTGGSGGAVNRATRASHDLEKLGVRPSPGVTKAVDMIDAWTLLTGRHLKAYPLLRLSFVFYLLFIHLWAFCLLAYHTHSLDLDNENANAMTNNNLGGRLVSNNSS